MRNVRRGIGFGWMAVILALLGAPTGALADPPTQPRWSYVVSTAPHHPQDIWVSGTGNNVDGWVGGGSVCVGPLAAGLGPGDHATIQLRPLEGGIYGVDGTPVPPTTYVAPGSEGEPGEPTGPAEELEAREFVMEPGRVFYAIFEGYVVESNIPGIVKGSTLRIMFTWDFDPNRLGRTESLGVAWLDFGGGFFPFLNEGVLMTNVRRHR